MSRPPSAATLVARLDMERAKVRAAYLAAKQRQITARIEALERARKEAA